MSGRIIVLVISAVIRFSQHRPCRSSAAGLYGSGRRRLDGAVGPELGLTKADPVALVDQRTAPMAVGRIIVKFKDTVSQDSLTPLLAERPDVTLDKSIAAIDAVVLNIPAGAEWKIIDQLRAQANREYAEPDYTLHRLR